MQKYCLRKSTQLERQLSFWTLHTYFVFTDVVKVKSKDKFMTRERLAKWCLSFIALFPRLKQGYYTLCRRRCIQSVPLEKLGISRSGRIHSSATLSLFRGNLFANTIPVTVIRKTCLLACCIKMQPKLQSCRVSVIFLRWIRISEQAHVIVGRHRKDWSQNMLRPAQAVTKERGALQGWLLGRLFIQILFL